MITGATAVAAPYAPAGPKIFGTSASEAPVDITGTKTFVMNEFALAFQVGVRLRMTATENLGAWIEGVVQTYDKSTKTLVILPDRSSGTGTYDSWSINVAGEPGPQGEVGPTGPTGPVPEAPNDGTLYGRRNLGWAIVSTEGIGEAPADGNNYARRNGVWNNVDAIYQPVDADLTALAALTGTNAIYYRSAANTWAAITVGANLTFTGGVLAATAASGAPINSPVFTGDPQAPTPSAADNDTSIATTAFVKTVIAGKADASALAGYQPLDGDLTTLAGLTGVNTIYYRSAANAWSPVTIGANLTFTGGVLAAAGTGAPLNSPVFTGNPQAPTPTAGDNDTSIATTAFVQAAIAGAPTSNWVNVRDYGAIGDGVTDDRASIQAAIDYAIANDIAAVYIPAGNYKTTAPLYLDAPVNLRTSMTGAPAYQGFSVHLFGDMGGPNLDGCGTTIRPSTNNFVVLWIGPGQNNMVSHLNIVSPLAATHKAYPATGVGIAIAAYSTRAMIQFCAISGFYRLIQTGRNQDTLADANTIFKCYLVGCYIAVDLFRTQNFINSIYDCVIGDYKIAINSQVSKQCQVFGGNFSSYGSVGGYVINSVTGLSGTHPNYTFSANILGPDTPWANGDYDSFVMILPGYGIVPLELVSYSAPTATFKFYENWRVAVYGLNTDLDAITDIETAILANTNLYAAERMYVFAGTGIHAKGVHVENAVGVTTLVYTFSGFGGETTNRLEDVYCNWTISVPGGPGQAAFNVQAGFPFVDGALNNGTTILDNIVSGQISSSEPITIDVNGGHRLLVSNCDFYAPNIRVHTQPGGPISSGDRPWQAACHGAGEWDRTPFLSRSNTFSDTYRIFGDGYGPMSGYAPSRHTLHRLRQDDITTILSGSLGSIGAIPAIHGGSPYIVGRLWSGGNIINDYSNVTRIVTFMHRGYSYGQNLTVNWTGKGQSAALFLNDTSKMFAGLVISIDNGVSGPIQYIVCRVYPGFGYVEVAEILDNTRIMQGVKTNTYSGATLVQEPYKMRLDASEYNVTKTSNYTLQMPFDWGTSFNNTGAVAQVNFTLPTPYPNMVCTFVITAVQTLRVIATGGATIQVAGSVSSSNGNASANTVGNVLKLLAVGSTKWVAVSSIGTWTLA
jgi:Pectate lyase superfamily protein